MVTLADKARQYAVTKERINNHKKLVGTERDRERYFAVLEVLSILDHIVGLNCGQI